MSNMNGNNAKRPAGTTTLVKPPSGAAITDSTLEWTGPASTYYGLPLVKKAHWGWQIVVYFFLGGIAAGSYMVSSIADIFHLDKSRDLIRAGRYLSLFCIAASPILLILDLGRPERFHHMLRIFKLRSVMSLGTWGLTTFGVLCGLTGAQQMANDGLLDWFPLLARFMRALPVKVIEGIGTFFGLFVGSYTGVLLSSTAVPLWARARHILGPLFLTSGVSTGLASLSLILSLTRPRRNQETLERLEGAEIIAMTTELGLLSALPSTLGSLGKPLVTGKAGPLFTVGTIGSGLVLPLLLRLGWKLTRKVSPRSLNIGASLLVLVGGLILRYVWIEAGRVSADDPQAVHHYNALEWQEGKNRL